ncbi:hypothetical protein [Nonomuraea basaltis]|nr:hypothetical protein [Nonomuraea basaltis]
MTSIASIAVIAVIGATGRTGRLIVEQALAAGHRFRDGTEA